jgi:hypothetical protein
MAMIDRYKKKGGFVQLLILLETTAKEKQEKFLKMIAAESPAWEIEIRKRLLSVDRVLAWNPVYLAEIFPRILPMQLAMIAGGLPPEKAEIFMKVMTYKEKTQVESILKEKKPSPAETSAGLIKFFSEVRKMEAEGSLVFDKFAPEMTIPDGIEDKLVSGNITFSTPLSIAPNPTPAAPNPAAASAATSVAPASPISPTPPPGTPNQVMEELVFLRRKVVQLTQENQRLNQENQGMKGKLEQIKKIA